MSVDCRLSCAVADTQSRKQSVCSVVRVCLCDRSSRAYYAAAVAAAIALVLLPFRSHRFYTPHIRLVCNVARRSSNRRSVSAVLSTRACFARVHRKIHFRDTVYGKGDSSVFSLVLICFNLCFNL